MSTQLNLSYVHVLSDLHLVQPGESFYQSVLRFIAEVPQPGDHLALAGDIFDVYVGDKAVFRELHRPFFEAVRFAGIQGVTVHHIEGNHDFGLRESYSAMGCSQAQVHSDSIEITMKGRILRVEHGDLADHSDRFYLLLRSFFRGIGGQSLIKVLPGGALDRLGQYWSNSSRNQKTLPDDWSKEDREKLRSIFFGYSKTRVGPGKADALVMGHCHDLHSCDGYMNVGFPRRHKKWVRWSPAENKLEHLAYDF